MWQKRTQVPAHVTQVLCAAALLSVCGATVGQAPVRPPASCSLQAEYLRLGLPAQQQQGDTCWAYSVIGCLELEVSRARGQAVQLSAPYLVWAASRADRTAFDRRGSNFGRAARALAMLGVCELKQVPTLDTASPWRTSVSDAAVAQGAEIGRNLEIRWLRFWQPTPGLDDAQVRAMKQLLAAGHPVAVGLRWPKETAVEDQVRCLLRACRSENDTFDGHCVTLVGYEDNPQEPGGGSFLFRNTWGDQWMDHGFARISYDHVRRFTNDALAFTVGSDVPHRLGPRRSAPSNVTTDPVVDVRRADCTPDPGLNLVDDDIGRMRQGVWQADNQVFCTPERVGQGFRVKVTVPEAGGFALLAAGTRAPDYGIYSFAIDGRRIGKPCDFGWPDVEPTGPLAIGVVTLSAGTHEVRLECAGKSPASTGLLLGLDWIRLQPQR